MLPKPVHTPSSPKKPGMVTVCVLSGAVLAVPRTSVMGGSTAAHTPLLRAAVPVAGTRAHYESLEPVRSLMPRHHVLVAAGDSHTAVHERTGVIECAADAVLLHLGEVAVGDSEDTRKM